MKRNHGQNVAAAQCTSCGKEANSTLGKRHRKCTKEKRGTWQRPPDHAKGTEPA